MTTALSPGEDNESGEPEGGPLAPHGHPSYKMSCELSPQLRPIHVLLVPWTHLDAAMAHSLSALVKVAISGDRVGIVQGANPAFVHAGPA